MRDVNVLKKCKPRQIETRSGIVEGKQLHCNKGSIDVFLGIPYAKPPTGERRFKKNGFPVMFYIHGGGYMIDSAVKYHYSKIAKLLVSKDVIVVTIQYRLGFLGFFTTNDEICPGNFGIWDQIMALKWIKENIEYFGGDPDRITVIGQSAGAASADLLALSPHSRDLFKQIILLGGNAECSWAVSDAKNCTDNAKMIRFLRKLPASKFAAKLIGNKELFTTGRLPLAPVIDGDLLPCPIIELRKQSPTKSSIVGLTEDEGLLFVAIGRLACDMKNIKAGIELIKNSVKDEIDAEQVISEIYLNRDNKCDNINNSRRNVQRAFINVT
ncbi:hypothetical protein WUBG_00941 [Wuchereria bancrofti]|uniref:Carboxylic ester hydrolase n=1 Tax=Wuchereria bancrofti TaxID=6293 RepID=J9EZW8_WUCBA|nr:hypothetical protein WUBG_00941 [Wuchereria bancrofti]